MVKLTSQTSGLEDRLERCQGLVLWAFGAQQWGEVNVWQNVSRVQSLDLGLGWGGEGFIVSAKGNCVACSNM